MAYGIRHMTDKERRQAIALCQGLARLLQSPNSGVYGSVPWELESLAAKIREGGEHVWFYGDVSDSAFKRVEFGLCSEPPISGS